MTIDDCMTIEHVDIFLLRCCMYLWANSSEVWDRDLGCGLWEMSRRVKDRGERGGKAKRNLKNGEKEDGEESRGEGRELPVDSS